MESDFDECPRISADIVIRELNIYWIVPNIETSFLQIVGIFPFFDNGH